jgi:hypothetical protein
MERLKDGVFLWDVTEWSEWSTYIQDLRHAPLLYF